MLLKYVRGFANFSSNTSPGQKKCLCTVTVILMYLMLINTSFPGRHINKKHNHLNNQITIKKCQMTLLVDA